MTPELKAEVYELFFNTTDKNLQTLLSSPGKVSAVVSVEETPLEETEAIAKEVGQALSDKYMGKLGLPFSYKVSTTDNKVTLTSTVEEL